MPNGITVDKSISLSRYWKTFPPIWIIMAVIFLGRKSRLIDFGCDEILQHLKRKTIPLATTKLIKNWSHRHWQSWPGTIYISQTNDTEKDDQLTSVKTMLNLQLVDTERDPRYEGGRLDQPALKIRFALIQWYIYNVFVY